MSNKQQRERKSAKGRAQQQTSNTYANTMFKLPAGVSEFYIKDEKTRRIEILPFKAGRANEGADEGQWTYELTYYMHRNVGADEAKVVCPRKMGKGKCPICEHRAELARDSDSDEELVKSLNPKKRQMFWLLDHGQKDEGAMVWDMSYHLFGRLLAERVNKDADDDEPEGYEFFYDEVDGYTLRIGITEQKQMYKFFEVTDIDFKKRSKPIPEKFVDATSPLSDMLTILSYDQLYAKYHQTEVQEAAPAKTRPPAKETVADDDWPDDEPAKEEPVKEEKPAKPAKGKAKAKAKPKKEQAPEPEAAAPAEEGDWDEWADEDTPAADADAGDYEDVDPPEADEPEQTTETEPAAGGDDDWSDW